MKNTFLLLEKADKNHLVKKEKQVRAKVNYLNNKDLLKEVAASKVRGEMTPKFAHMLQTLCKRYGSKGSYANYSYNEDMQAYAMLSLCQSWKGFNEAKSKNPFAYYTQCIKSSFNQFLNYEKKHRNTRDLLLIEAGMNPSHTFQIENAMHYQEDSHELNPNANIRITDNYGDFDSIFSMED